MTTAQETRHHLSTRGDTAVIAELVDAPTHFGKGAKTVQAVRGLDLEVHSGELPALLGPYGAGWSTAVGMLTGLTAPTSGAARLSGRDPRDVRAAAPRRVLFGIAPAGDPDLLMFNEPTTAHVGRSQQENEVLS